MPTDNVTGSSGPKFGVIDSLQRERQEQIVELRKELARAEAKAAKVDVAQTQLEEVKLQLAKTYVNNTSLFKISTKAQDDQRAAEKELAGVEVEIRQGREHKTRDKGLHESPKDYIRMTEDSDAALKEKLAEALKDAHDGTATIERLEEENKNVSAENRVLKQSLNTNNENLTNLERNLDLAEKVAEERSGTIKRNQEEISRLKDDARGADEQLEAARKEVEKLEKDQTAAGRTESQLRDQISALQEENRLLVTAEEENGALQAQMMSLGEQMAELEAANQELQDLLADDAPTDADFEEGADNPKTSQSLSAQGFGLENLDQNGSSGEEDEMSNQKVTKDKSVKNVMPMSQNLTSTIFEVANIAPESPPVSPPAQTLTMAEPIAVADVHPVTAPLRYQRVGRAFYSIGPEPLNPVPEPQLELAPLPVGEYERRELVESLRGPMPPPVLPDGVLNPKDPAQFPTALSVQDDIVAAPQIPRPLDDHILIPTEVYRNFNPWVWFMSVYVELWNCFLLWLNTHLSDGRRVPVRRIDMANGRRRNLRHARIANIADFFHTTDRAVPSGIHAQIFEDPLFWPNFSMLLSHLFVFGLMIFWILHILNLRGERNIWLAANSLTRQYVADLRQNSSVVLDAGWIGSTWFGPLHSLDGLRYSLHALFKIDRSFPG